MGKWLSEGKTKAVREIDGEPYLVLVVNKDRISAFDGESCHIIDGKCEISNDTNAKIFQYLNAAGVKTSFIEKKNIHSYIARKCHMIPLEWVTRRIATGSFLKRNPGVKEGYKFAPVKLETFLKDDANNDPQWSKEQILAKEFKIHGVTIGLWEYEMMAKTTVAVFEVLEHIWACLDCALIDMKVEFGIDDETKEILLSDVIDSDSWRLWPSGEKRLMKDKQVYRDLKTVTEEDLMTVKTNFEWVAKKLQVLQEVPKQKGLAVIIMGSSSDLSHAQLISQECLQLGVRTEMKIASAHKATDATLQIVEQYESLQIPLVFIAIAGRSNGLGPVIAGNSSYPVINCPPLKKEDIPLDIWSSMKMPSGLGCTTVLYPEAAAQAAASILGLQDHEIWSKVRVKRLNLWNKLIDSDKQLQISG